ncbi:GPDH [Hepatospora eriocheir]|uniref:Glycerol-3-phosphate dehydrogenase n=1 Tax=Hepatospora eriocheir TaxID=1081669 RepID=A0A1X0QL43_9MICR|nr:GPDH [Hepatospora eriocheir]
MILTIIFTLVLVGLIRRFILYKIDKRILKGVAELENGKDFKNWKPDKREKTIKSLKLIEYDICVIGGGSTGVGCALDAVTRGLKVALIEAMDLSYGTSSKSTKLLHGGVRYLDKALSKLNFGQFKLVKNALFERRGVMRIAPYLTSVIPIMVPIYSKMKLIYFYILLTLYDWLAWKKAVGRSYFLTKKATELNFKNLRKDYLIGSMVYYDGAMDDARINVMLGVTSAFYGADICNYVKFIEFVKEKGVIKKAIVLDVISQTKFAIKVKVFISAVGSFTDKVRNQNIQTENIMVHSKGTHITCNSIYGPRGMGLVDTCTDDNRMMFLIPWMDKLVTGSTEIKGELNLKQKPNKDEIQFLIDEVQKYNSSKIKIKNVTASWSGLRPFVKSRSDNTNTETLIRSYKSIDDRNGLITITGGKWTTYKEAAREAVDLAVVSYNLNTKNESLTEHIRILGSKYFSKDLFTHLSLLYNVNKVFAKHLQDTYGDKAFKVYEYTKTYPGILSKKYNYRIGEIYYQIDYEFAVKPGDVLNRRLRIGFLDVYEAKKVGPKVIKIMSDYFNWDDERISKEIKDFKDELETMGLLELMEFKNEK